MRRTTVADSRERISRCSRRRRRQPCGIGLAVALFGLACGDTAPSPAPTTETETAAEAPEPEPAPPALAPSGQPYSEERVACANRDPERQVFWGELHVHSRLSMDAYLWDVRGGPDETYRFAKGEEIAFPPLDEAGVPTRPAQLERPLDFAALTDHASYQGEVSLCTTPGSEIYDSQGCGVFRGEIPVEDATGFGNFAARMGSIGGAGDEQNIVPKRNTALCGEDGTTCKDAMRAVWDEQQAAAERHYDRSAECSFTTFHGYEYTATPGLAKVHHNVIFRNAAVPASPLPWVDIPDVYDLWKGLRSECLDAGIGCDVITIPHNSNLSNGNMFAVTGKDLPLEEQRARAVLRRDVERLVEITQIKGDSECRNGMYQVMGAPDEFCDYEHWRWRPPETPDCEEGTGVGALMGQGCVSRNDFVRYALLEGQREQNRLGVNPYKLGFIAATDAHNANPGDAEEYSYQGWSGAQDATPGQRLTAMPPQVPSAATPLASNPGGLAAVWAEENSRDALFDAMKRRETFATSGPRMTARFFGGWDYPADWCESADRVAAGYAGGVPMGGDLPGAPEGATAPVFAISTLRDPGVAAHPGGLLQRAQVVKGWVDDEGRYHQAVYDVAGGDNDASVDTNTCEVSAVGHDDLCAVWQDPEFDASRRAVYYLRVLENPSCRWNQLQCLALPEGERPSGCNDPNVPRVIQERLWTSPIWYEGPAAG
ncbi:MAG: DUF3604 domain-containing protein [Myxococcota bacterium]